jgi:hypothetical protein
VTVRLSTGGLQSRIDGLVEPLARDSCVTALSGTIERFKALFESLNATLGEPTA